jgi:predicted Fe-Mo cluster-binding NifX family protein
MIFCIPTNDNKGIEAKISPHFGRAPWFTIVNESTGEVELLRNDEGKHVHGACVPTEEILRRGVKGVVCRGIGRGASARLFEAGISVYLTDESVASSALEAVRAGRARTLDGAGACSDDHGNC